MFELWDEYFVLQQESTSVHCAHNAVQMLNCEILDFLSPDLWLPTAQSWTTDYKISCTSMSKICKSAVLKTSSNDWLKSGKAVIQHLSKNNVIYMSLLKCQVVQEH